MAGGLLWSLEEIERLFEAIKKYGRQWQKVSEYVGTKTRGQCQGKVQFEVRTGRLECPNGKQERSSWKVWTEKELLKLYLAVKKYGRDWIRVSEFVGSMTNEQCRQRVIKEVRAGRMQNPVGKRKLTVTKTWTQEELEKCVNLQESELDEKFTVELIDSNTKKRPRLGVDELNEDSNSDEELIRLRKLVNEQNLADFKASKKTILAAALNSRSLQRQSVVSESNYGVSSGNSKYEQALEQALLNQMLLNEALMKAAPGAAAATVAGISGGGPPLMNHQIVSNLSNQGQETIANVPPVPPPPGVSGGNSSPAPRSSISGISGLASMRPISNENGKPQIF